MNKFLMAMTFSMLLLAPGGARTQTSSEIAVPRVDPGVVVQNPVDPGTIDATRSDVLEALERQRLRWARFMNALCRGTQVSGDGKDGRNAVVVTIAILATACATAAALAPTPGEARPSGSIRYIELADTASTEAPAPETATAATELAQAASTAPAPSWPIRPVKIIVSQAAGGAPDTICRLITDRLARALGQQFVVENRPGSGNIVGAQAAARAAPDGYTVFFATAAALVTNPYTFKSLPYDPVRDFAPVAMVAKGPFFVLAHPSVPVKTLAELVAYDRAHPGKLAFATDGPRNFSGMVAAWLNKLMGTQILAVPYANMPQGVQDTLAGRTQLVVLAVPAAAPFIKRGELNPLAETFARRIPGYEAVPTVAETFPGFEFIGWFAFVAPAGTQADIVQKMNREIDKVLREPEVTQRLATLGFYTEGGDTPEGTGRFIQAERANWGRIVKEIGMQPE